MGLLSRIGGRARHRVETDRSGDDEPWELLTTVAPYRAPAVRAHLDLSAILSRQGEPVHNGATWIQEVSIFVRRADIDEAVVALAEFNRSTS